MAPTVEYRSNVVTFSSTLQTSQNNQGAGIVSGWFKIKDFSITPQQDPNHNISSPSTHLGSWINNGFNFTFNIGREASRDVAEFWNRQFISNQTTISQMASTLNFALVGTLTLEYRLPAGSQTQTLWATFDDVGLAQGSSSIFPNWWFASKHATRDGSIADSVQVQGVDSGGAATTWTFTHGNSANDINKYNIIHVSKIEYTYNDFKGPAQKIVVSPA